LIDSAPPHRYPTMGLSGRYRVHRFFISPSWKWNGYTRLGLHSVHFLGKAGLKNVWFAVPLLSNSIAFKKFWPMTVFAAKFHIFVFLMQISALLEKN
jgi:hypothetical protein